MKQAVSSPALPKPIGPYSPALRCGSLLFVSGQVPVEPQSGNLVSGDIAAETRQVLDNVGALLRAAGLGFDDVVRTTVFLTDIGDFAAMNAAYASYFREPFPARATVQVAALPREARIEIDVIASFEAATAR